MAARDLEVGLTVKLRDQASQPAQQAGAKIDQAVRKSGQSYADTSRVAVNATRYLSDARITLSAKSESAVQAAAHRTATVQVQATQQVVQANVAANRNILTGSQRLANAREQLAVRSDQAIRRELDKTVAAYNRLHRAGFSSANEQSRAFSELRKRVAELNSELRQTEKVESTLSRSGRGIGAAWRAGSVVAGAAAGAMVIRPAVSETMSYDRRLAMMANTAYSDRDVAGRRAGMTDLNNAIVGAVRYGGGSREQAADTLDNLLASGAVSEKSALKLLPTLQKFSTATGADPNELGNIAIRGMQNFGIKEEEIPRALDMALKGGQAGGFELKDMSKWLPQQMALAKTAGMSGLADFGKLIVANQAAVITAGTKDEAGNNLVNLLEKLNSADTQIKGKKLGIDVTGSLAASRAQGVDALDAFAGIVNRVMQKDPRYQKVQKQLAGATNDGERKAILQSQASLLQGSAIGTMIHDRQALGALIPYLNQRDYMKTVSQSVFSKDMAVDTNFSLMQSTASFKTQQLDNEATFAKQSAFEGFNQKLGDTADKLTDYARQYPALTSSIVGATEAIKTFAAAAGAAAAVTLIRGGMGAAPAEATAAKDAAAATAAGALGGSSRGATALRAGIRGLKTGGIIGVGMQTVASGLEAYTIANDKSLTPDQKKAGYFGAAGGAVGGVAGMATGAAVGAAVGSVIPGVGNVVGLVAGAIAGYFGHDFGEKVGKSIADAITANHKDEPAKPQPIQVSVHLDGINLADQIIDSMHQSALRN